MCKFFKYVTEMLNIFAKYISIGFVNTIIHWTVFIALVFFFKQSQALSNIIGFISAVTFSFFANSKWTFQSKATPFKYLSFTIFMGLLAALTGYMADLMRLPSLLTLIIFSSFSLLIGFFYSRYFVFRETK